MECIDMFAKCIDKLKPAVDKRVLPLLAGLVWVVVGMMLTGRAVVWLLDYHGAYWYMFMLLGIALFVIKYRLVFKKLVDRNLLRITGLKDRPCVFSFVSWKSYLLIVTMASLGIFLRNSIIPLEYLSVVYLGVGFAMVISGMQYFTAAVRMDW